MNIRINNSKVFFAKSRNLYDASKDIPGYYIRSATTGTDPKRAIEGNYAISADIPVKAGDVVTMNWTKPQTSNYLAMLDNKGLIVNGTTYEPVELMVTRILQSKTSVTFQVPDGVVAICFTTIFNGKSLGDIEVFVG